MTSAPHLDAMPASPHMERTVLGACLFDPAAVTDALSSLEPSDFSLDSHQRIFRAILSLHTDGQHIDSSTVRERLAQRRELDSIGGLSYLLDLTLDPPRNFNVESYCRIVKEKSRLRSAITVIYNAYQSAGEHENDVQGFLDRIGADLGELAEDHSGNDILQVGEYLQSHGAPETIFERMATPDGIKLGFGQWDELTGGAQRDELIIIAARPSMGKTAWMCTVSQHITVHEGKVAAVFSLEQRKNTIIRRMISSAARIDYQDIRKGNLRQQDRTLLLERRAMLCRAPLYIDDTPGLTVTRIRAKCLRLKRRAGLDIVFVDQLSHVSMADCRERDFRLKVGEQTKMLKRLAQELCVPVVVFNQLKRGESKGDIVPRLSDLKESGNIEEDADVVTFLHRPEYYDKHDESLRGKGQMIVAKNREGATATLDCIYQGRILRWEDDYTPAASQDELYGRTPW